MISEELILGAGVLAVAIAVTMTKKEKKKPCSAIKLATVSELDKFESEVFNTALTLKANMMDRSLRGAYKTKVQKMKRDEKEFNNFIASVMVGFVLKTLEQELERLKITSGSTNIGLVIVGGDVAVFGDFTVNQDKVTPLSEEYVTEVRLKDKNGPLAGDLMLCQEGKFPGYELKDKAAFPSLESAKPTLVPLLVSILPAT